MNLQSAKTLNKEAVVKGAEAEIFHGEFLGKKVIVKTRIPKTYRITTLDNKLRKERSMQEIRILNFAKSNGLPVPRIYDVIKEEWTIVMEMIQGDNLKQFLNEGGNLSIFRKLGEIIGKFHNLDIIHGDLTTSNIIINKNSIWIIDFGLGYISTEIEDKAVDLLVLKHTLESSHPNLSEKAVELIFNSYNSKEKGSILDRLKTVENRVRYRSH